MGVAFNSSSRTRPGQHYIICVCCILYLAMSLSACSREMDPKAAAYLTEAQTAFERNAYNVALILTDSAALYDPTIPDLHFMRGRIYTEVARFDLADSSYREALHLNPELKGAWLNLGNLAMRRGALQPALALYRKEEKNHPSASLYLQMGRAYAELGVADSAQWAYETALLMDSTRATLFMRLGQLYGEQGDLDEAIEMMQRGLALEPDNLNYHYAIGSLLNAAERSEEAVSYLKPYADTNPWHYWSHYNLAQAYQRLGKADEAEVYLNRAEALQETQDEIDHWQRMAESNPKHLMLWIRFSYALRRAGNTGDADRADRVASALASDYLVHQFEDPDIRRAHGQAVLHLSSGEHEEAIEIYRDLLRSHQTNADLWLNLGVAYAAFGRIVQARQSWTVALKYNNEYVRARRYMEDLDKAFYDPESPGALVD